MRCFVMFVTAVCILFLFKREKVYGGEVSAPGAKPYYQKFCYIPVKLWHKKSRKSVLFMSRERVEKRLAPERFQSSILKLNEHACHAQHLT